jgi:RNA polymerase sigma-70 factor, ECF subfamily
MRKNGDIDVSDTTQSSNPEASIRLATFDQYRSLLFSIAYRMLGSVADAEDMLQETFIRWQQAANDNIDSPRAFLVTIVSRLCINALITCSLRAYNAKNMWDSGCRNRS